MCEKQSNLLKAAKELLTIIGLAATIKDENFWYPFTKNPAVINLRDAVKEIENNDR